MPKLFLVWRGYILRPGRGLLDCVALSKTLRFLPRHKLAKMCLSATLAAAAQIERKMPSSEFTPM
jgi:hypothetical protein